jgi:hypothetical protein
MVRVAGDPDEGVIKEMMGIGNKMYAIKERAIYSFMLADNIDPGRTNPAIPNVQQKAYDIGYDSELVARTLLTAKFLFKDGMLDTHFNPENILPSVLDFFEETFALLKSFETFSSEIQGLVDSVKKQQKHGASVLLPAVPDLRGKVKGFVQRAEHATQALLALCKVFYEFPGNKHGFISFPEAVAKRGNADPSMLQWAEHIAAYAKFLRNCRHCVEHPHNDQKIVLTDFAINPVDGQLNEPMLEVVHRETPEPRLPIGAYMRSVLNSTVTMGEELMAFLALDNMLPGWKDTTTVMEMPPERRRHPNVRFYYAINLGGVMQPVG